MRYARLVHALPSATQETPAILLDDLLPEVGPWERWLGGTVFQSAAAQNIVYSLTAQHASGKKLHMYTGHCVN